MAQHRSITFLILLLIVIAMKAQETTPKEWAMYNQLNEKETRLSEYMDNEDILRLKLRQLEVINQSRKKHNAKPVQLDILASRVANKMAVDAAQNNFMGHFNQNGEKPYHRYAFAGGVDHVSENAAAISSSLPIPNTSENIQKYMGELHQEFMNEKAPNDGHKQTVIDPFHNYVGIGIAMINNQFRYYEEYLDRYLQFGDFPKKLKAGSEIQIPLKPLSNKHHLYWVSVQYEPFPKKMSIEKINRQTAYDDFTGHPITDLAPWEFPEIRADGYTYFTFHLPKKGLYYLQVFLSDKPYRSGSASTKGKIQASGVVIEVK